MDPGTWHESRTRATKPGTADACGAAELPPLGPPAAPGDLGTFGGYRVVRLLGYGGMGAVYEAVDPLLGRPVALKVMLPALASSEHGRERFLREARAAAAVRHPHVVTIYQVGEGNGGPFLAMELLAGRTLAERMATGRVPAVELVRVGREVADGLAAAHAAGVIHRDVKPENIWLETAGPGLPPRAKLLDFGLARVADSRPLTARGGVLGTLAYMAPEQADGRSPDPRADLFGLGVVLYRATAGRLPFTGRSPAALMADVRRNDPPPLAVVAPDLPPPLAELMHRLLAADPDRRPGSAAEVARALAAIEVRLLLPADAPERAVWQTISDPEPPPLPWPPATPLPETAAEVARVLAVVDANRTPPPAEPSVWKTLDDLDLSAAEAARRRPAATRRLVWMATVAACLSAAVVGLIVRKAPDPPPTVTVKPAAVKPAETKPAETKPAEVKPPEAVPVPLFNGKDLTGWHPTTDGRMDGWTVTDGVLRGTPKPGGFRWLLSDREYDDFDLRLEYRWLRDGGHTFLSVRAYEGAGPEGPVQGIRVNLRDEVTQGASQGRKDWPLYRTGGVYMLSAPNPAELVLKPVGEWNRLRVVARRQRLTVEHNGRVTADLDLDQFTAKVNLVPGLARTKGAIGLCSHVWQPIEYRNVTVAPAP